MPPGVEGYRKNAEKAIAITEGEKKALALVQEGCPAIGLGGVWMFADPRAKGQGESAALHPEVQSWAKRGRRITLVFDQDRRTKDSVASAAERICRKLAECGVLVFVADVPGLPGLEKVGIDDLLVHSGPEAVRRVLHEAALWQPFACLLDLVPADLPGDIAEVQLRKVCGLVARRPRSEREEFIRTARDRFPAIREETVRGYLVATRPGARHDGSNSAPPKEVPDVQVNDRQLRDVVDDAWVALRESAYGGALFRRGPRLVYIPSETGSGADPGAPEALNPQLMRAILTRAATWVARTGDAIRDVSVPPDVARDMVAMPSEAIPTLDLVVRVPVMLPDHSFAVQPGYHPQGRVFQAGDPTQLAVVSSIPDAPGEGELAGAVALLLDDLLADFPFVGDSARAHALAAIITPFVRPAILGPIPLFLIDAPTEGTGKGLLAEVIILLATGASAEVTTIPASDEEMRKRVTATLLGCPACVLLDNLSSLDSRTFSAALTSRTWSDRVLGQSAIVSIPNRTVWLATGNNVVLSNELFRRTLSIRLDSGREEPWNRDRFRHDPLLRWVGEQRWAIIRAIVVIVRSWVAAGGIRGTARRGSFDDFAGVLDGILQNAGVPGFLKDGAAPRLQRDPLEGDWIALCTLWRERFGSANVRAGELLALAGQSHLLDVPADGAADHSTRTRFSRFVSKKRDRRYGDYILRVSADLHTKQALYRLEPAS